ncbi:MAG: hypothetical protein HPY57_15200 [Ignavibacteria bacterium]|nr:hypothetical protein [Ignavibacteria bacterium]
MKDAGISIETKTNKNMNTNNLTFIKDIEYYDFDKSLDKDVKVKFENYLTKRMKEETKNGRFQFKGTIDLNKTSGIVSLYKDENGKNVY